MRSRSVNGEFRELLSRFTIVYQTVKDLFRAKKEVELLGASGLR